VVAAVAGIEAYRIVRAERDRQVDPAARAL
jgi:hypothetical protein